MAYFETLGQLQSNDETFTCIYNLKTPLGTGTKSITINGNVSSFEINDIIMIYLHGGRSSGTTSLSVSNISGVIKLFENLSTSKGTANTEAITVYIYIGKAIDTSLTITWTGTDFHSNDLSVYRLVPR